MASIIPYSVNAGKGQRVKFSCLADGVGAGTFSYGWLLNGIPIDGKAKQILTASASEDIAGNYQCTVRNIYNGFGKSPVATLMLS